MKETRQIVSLEDLVKPCTRALVIGVGGGGDIVGALGAARFFEFLGIGFMLGGLPWERPSIDPLPGPRSFKEVTNVRPIHEYAWLANSQTRTITGVAFAESEVARLIDAEILLVDITGGVQGVVAALERALMVLEADLLVGIDVGGDSLAQGSEAGLCSPLADSIMLAAFTELQGRGHRALWGVFGYGSDGEMTSAEIEYSLSRIARDGGLLGAWALTNKVLSELEYVVQHVRTEASAIPLACARGAWGERRIREDKKCVKLTPLSALTFFISPTVLFHTLSAPAQVVKNSSSIDEANEALHLMGLRTELDVEREEYQENCAG